MTTFDATGDPIPWGTDTSISLPHPDVDPDTARADVGGGFVFTPMGLRFDLNESDRAALISQAHRPQDLPRG